MDHLALAVSDQARSIVFYTHYFGFVPEAEPREERRIFTRSRDQLDLHVRAACHKPHDSCGK